MINIKTVDQNLKQNKFDNKDSHKLPHLKK